MNRSAIDEENKVEISGVYHLDPWETFGRSEKVCNRTELDEFIKNKSDSHSNHKPIIAEAIERYAKEKNKLIDDEPSFLHIIWAGDLSGNGNIIQLEQLLFHFIQSELDRFKIKQALFTNFFMFKHNVISHETLEKLFNPERLPSDPINTRPYNKPIMKQLSDTQIDLKIFNVNDLTVSVGDEIEDFIFELAAGKLTSDDFGRIKREPYHIRYKPSVKELFHVEKLEYEQLKKLDKNNPDKKYVKSFREGTLYFSAKDRKMKQYFAECEDWEKLLDSDASTDEDLSEDESFTREENRYPDVPGYEMITMNQEMNKENIFEQCKSAFMSSKYAILAINPTFKYALSQCTRQTLLIVGSAKIPPCYH